MLPLLTRPSSLAEAESVTRWRYLPPFDRYDLDPDGARAFLQRSADGEGCYPPLVSVYART